MSGLIATLVFVCLAQGFERAIYLDLAVALALLSFAGGLVFVHFLERWV
jgi:multisubunit Na+/H+ antiporter MnhF subunit